MPSEKLNCNFLDFQLNTPFVLASGVIGTSATLMARAAHNGAGMITAKSCGPTPRAGHPNPVAFDWGGGLINAIGLTNPGATEEAKLLAETRARLQPLGVPLIASIFAGTVTEFGSVARTVAAAKPDIIEVNISCPNVGDEFGTPFAGTIESAAAVTDAVRQAVDCPIAIKLAPNVPGIARIAAAVVEAGADAITAINTMPGMVIDAASGQPVLRNRVGGISGPAAQTHRPALRVRNSQGCEGAHYRYGGRIYRAGCRRNVDGRGHGCGRGVGGVLSRGSGYGQNWNRTGQIYGAAKHHLN